MATNTNPNMDTISRIYNMYAEDVKRYFVSQFHDVMLAEDMLQDLFLKVIKKDLISEQTAKNLLFVIAHRMVIDRFRHQALVQDYQRSAMYEMEMSTPNMVIAQMDAARIVKLEGKCLSQMKERPATIYQLFVHEEKSAKEIAEEMQMNLRTVEGYILRSKKTVREYLSKCM